MGIGCPPLCFKESLNLIWTKHLFSAISQIPFNQGIISHDGLPHPSEPSLMHHYPAFMIMELRTRS